MKVIGIICALVSTTLVAAETVPPEVPARTKSSASASSLDEQAPQQQKPAVSECPPQKEIQEGKLACICEQKACKPTTKTVYRDKIVDRPVTVTKIKTVPKIVEKVKYVDKIVEKPVEKIVYKDKIITKEAELKRFNISLFYGRGPDGMDPVLYKKADGEKEYKVYKDYGNIYAGQLTFRFTESWNASVMYISNESYLGGVGYSFLSF